MRSFVRLCARVDRRLSSCTHPSNRFPPQQSVQDGLPLDLVRELLAFMDPDTVSLATRAGQPVGWTALLMAANGVDALGQRSAILRTLLKAMADAAVPLADSSPKPLRHLAAILAKISPTHTSPIPHRTLADTSRTTETAPMPHLSATGPKPQQ